MAGKYVGLGKIKNFNFHIIHNRDTACCLNYHAVWGTSFNRPVLKGDVAEFVLSETKRKADEMELTIHKLRIVNEHLVEIVFSSPLKNSLTDVLKTLKGKVAQQAVMKFPNLKDECYMGKLWNRSYYIETLGLLTSVTVRNYIKNQERGKNPAVHLKTGKALPDWLHTVSKNKEVNDEEAKK